MSVVTRFAPSPTGFLHIGGARTALFNWLFARHYGGEFLLRIEDTDRERSTQQAVDAIFESMKWLGLDWDQEPIFQYSRSVRHQDIAQQLLDRGAAYKCYCTPEELDLMREEAKAQGKPPVYNGYWRDRPSSEAPKDKSYVVRFKAPKEGHTVIQDGVQGEVTVANENLDDFVILRSDGSPTYMLAVVVDDHDMGVTHIIRGDDHLTNAFKQVNIYKALDWDIPHMSHIPLIHGSDGAKLSKRHGALGTETYKDMGFLPEAICNYLARLGWSHGDDEIFSIKKAIQWFDGTHLGKSPSRFDMDKLTNLNGHYIQNAENAYLVDLVKTHLGVQLSTLQQDRLLRGMSGLKTRAKTLVDLAESATIYLLVEVPLAFTEKAQEFIRDKDLLKAITNDMEALTDWTHDTLHDWAQGFAEKMEIKLGAVAQPIRAALCGSTVSPGIFEVAEILGKETTLTRLKHAITQ